MDGKATLEWEGSIPIKTLINKLLDLAVEGFEDVILTTVDEEVDLDCEDGAFDIVKSPKLIAKF